ncbi:hypothetical protein PSE_2753 [Pseudovibrio sp. FO-BEG1]|nr:hypothetical protein PSE_2753 [Pseudovibrio sp. FO-BEG1]
MTTLGYISFPQNQKILQSFVKHAFRSLEGKLPPT